MNAFTHFTNPVEEVVAPNSNCTTFMYVQVVRVSGLMLQPASHVIFSTLPFFCVILLHDHSIR
jgi:hypothetical protein